MNKKELRKEILARRNALSEEERQEKSKQIANRVMKLESFKKSNVLLLYASMKSEVETTAIVEGAIRCGKEIYYPKVLGERMDFYRVDERTEFEISDYGIQEPKPGSTKVFEPKARERIFVLVPGVVFDTEGNRIGYGGGYYDKYLQWLESETLEGNVCKVAVAYECQLVEVGVIESESHDMRVDYVITEDEKMKNSYRYFENRECKYYPCHEMEHINCLFCYCPLNHLACCPGTPNYIEVNGNIIKDCSQCTFPHESENYDLIMELLSKELKNK